MPNKTTHSSNEYSSEDTAEHLRGQALFYMREAADKGQSSSIGAWLWNIAALIKKNRIGDKPKEGAKDHE